MNSPWIKRAIEETEISGRGRMDAADKKFLDDMKQKLELELLITEPMENKIRFLHGKFTRIRKL